MAITSIYKINYKKVINGRMYDTDTAERLFFYRTNYTVNDYAFCVVGLYRSPKGQYFLAGFGSEESMFIKEGGVLITYVVNGHLVEWGEDLVLLTEDEAKKWLEQFGTTEDYQRNFSVVAG